jgi:ATP-dependent protease ClpP protease subunit
VAYATFCDDIDSAAVNRIFGNFAGVTQQGIGEVHLLFQSAGGSVSDGVSLFNFFRGMPIALHLYNTGGVASAALIAFVGAEHRYASAHAAFLLHKTRHSLLTPGQSIDHRALADTLAIEDARSEAILRGSSQIPADKWAVYASGAEVPITAQEAALQYGLVVAIREFKPPAGGQLFHI